jgi:beta-glucosidase-like glycosyl hydrolase
VAGSPGVTFAAPTPYATSFPEPSVSAASFNHSLWAAIGNVIATEARAFANVGHAGLTFWTPNINIVRDPRWGRTMETPGEDPYLNGEYARVFVNGIQVGEDPRYLKASPCLKHYAAYSLENYNGMQRYSFNAVVSDQDLADTYLPAFQAGVTEGHSSGLMCSYNAVNGVPSCANDFLLQEILRDTWNFDGYVTSDCDAVSCIINNHHYTNTSDQTVYDALTAGTDTDCGWPPQQGSGYYAQNLGQALADGSVSLEFLQQQPLTNLYTVLFRLGLFDNPENQPYRQIQPSAINTPASQELALDAARQSIVLLKNNGALPLSKSAVRSIAVVGPNANVTTTMQGNYYGTAPYLINPVAGFQQYGSVNYQQVRWCGPAAGEGVRRGWNDVDFPGSAGLLDRGEHDDRVPGGDHGGIECGRNGDCGGSGHDAGG